MLRIAGPIVGSQTRLGHTSDQNTPSRVGADTDWIAVAAGNGHSLALEADASLWVAGAYDHGQLGTAGADHHTFPRVGTDDDWGAIAVGDDTTFAIKADHSLWA